MPEASEKQCCPEVEDRVSQKEPWLVHCKSGKGKGPGRSLLCARA